MTIRLTPLAHAGLLLALAAVGCGHGDGFSHRAARAAAAGVTSASVGAAPVASSPPAGSTPPAAVTSSSSPDDHGNDAVTATPIEHAMPFAGHIEAAGDEDWFAVILRAGVACDLKTFTAEDTTLELLDGAGATLASNDDEAPGSLASRIAGFTPAASGTFFLVVRGFQATTPRYVLRAFISPSLVMPRLTRAELIDVDRSGGASAGDQLLVTFDEPVARSSPNASGQAADDFALRVTGDDLGAGATVALGPAPEQAVITLGSTPALVVAGEFDGRRRAPGDPSGIDIAYSNLLSSRATSLPPARWAVDIADGGVVPVTAPASPPSSPPPSPSPSPTPASPDDHGDTPAAATPLALTQPFAGRIEVAGDVDCFAVDLRAGFPCTFLTETAGDTSLEVVDPSGQQVAFNDDAGPGTRRSEVAYTPSIAGTYALLVRGPQGALPDYTLRGVVSGALRMPRLVAARLDDRDGSGDVSAGDAVVMTFNEPVYLPAPTAPAAVLPAADHLACVVRGDALGAGAGVSPGPAPEQLTIILGASPRLTTAGTFDGGRLQAGAPSGLDVTLTTRITGRTSGQRASRWSVDVE